MSRRTAAIAALVLAAVLDLTVTGWHVLLAFIAADPGAFYLWLGIGAIVMVAITSVALGISQHPDPAGVPALAGDAEEHVKPLRQPTPAESTLTTDLRQRRMLLRPRGLSEHKAAVLAAKTARRALRMRGVRALATRTGAPSPVPVPAAETALLPITDVPGRESAGPRPTASQTPAGDPAPKRGRHRGQPKPWRSPASGPSPDWAEGEPVPLPNVTVPRGPLLVPSWAVVRTADPLGGPLPSVPAAVRDAVLCAAPVTDSPARETPVPGSEGFGPAGPGLATEAPAESAAAEVTE